MNRDRIIELFNKQSKEDKEYIIAEIIKSLSENEDYNKLKSEMENIKLELFYYKENSPKVVKDHIKILLKEPKEDKSK